MWKRCAALGLLRTAGFKLHLHWMPNLFGATPESDRPTSPASSAIPAIRPDELKIYPCSLIAGTELYERWQAGKYQPYTLDEMVAAGRCQADHPALHARQPPLPRHSGASHPGRCARQQPAPDRAA
jgi:hypothetical protein